MIHSHLTSKAQTTVPKPVRATLGLKEGDILSYRIEGDCVVVTRASGSADLTDNPFALFAEWGDDFDAAFDDL